MRFSDQAVTAGAVFAFGNKDDSSVVYFVLIKGAVRFVLGSRYSE